MDFYTLEKTNSIWLPREKYKENISFNTNSWFDINVKYTKSSKSFSLDGLPKDTHTVLRMKKIHLYPTKKQRELLLSWVESYRNVYNLTIDYLKDKKISSFYTARKEIKPLIPTSWKNTNVPAHTLDNAIHDVFKALDVLISQKMFKWGDKLPLRYKKKTSNRQIVTFEASAFSKEGILCPKTLGYIQSSEPFVEEKRDSILQYNRKKGDFYLFMPVERESKFCKCTETCALDPGIRSFLTGYVTSNSKTKSILSICNSPIVKFKKQLKKLDKYQSINTSSSRNKYHKVYRKVVNQIEDMHNKVCNFLCLNYKTIVIGRISTKSIVKGEQLGKLSKRLAYLLSHFTFRQKLQSKCEECGVRLIVTEESYTSCTCTKCGNVNKNLGSSKVYECNKCKYVIDRDVNGARNILMKVM